MQKGLDDSKNELKERMQKGQEETKQEMQKGLEIVQKCQEELKDSLEEKISSVEDRIAEKMKEAIAVVEEKMTQLSITSEANGWTEGVKACQLAASHREEAAEVLQTLLNTERLNLSSLYNALDLRFGQNNCAQSNLFAIFRGWIEGWGNPEGYGEIERGNANHKGWNFKPRETQLQVLGMRGTGHLRKTVQKEGRENRLFFQKGKLINGHLAGRKLPDNERLHHKIFQITAVNVGDKGLYVIGQINNISCRIVVDTAANVSISREELAQNSKVSIIWTPPSVSLQTVAAIVKSLDISHRLGQEESRSTRFGVDYCWWIDVFKKDSYPLKRIDDTLDTLAGNTLFSTLDLKSGCWQVELHPDDKEKTAFTTGQGLWSNSPPSYNVINIGIGPVGDESIRKDQLADPEIKPIIEFKESSDEKPSWQEIAPFHPTTKRYWALWDSLYLRNSVLYQK
ncbi:retrovirus-related Pol polyprotein from transposon 412 [Trichonephila clavipes]|nr:retrovirus-related Pol polyprotein from transposon 412 [Trichonephila clavipes]